MMNVTYFYYYYNDDDDDDDDNSYNGDYSILAIQYTKITDDERIQLEMRAVCARSKILCAQYSILYPKFLSREISPNPTTSLCARTSSQVHAISQNEPRESRKRPE